METRSFEQYRKMFLELLVTTFSKQTIIFLFFVFLSAGFWMLQALDDVFEAELRMPVRLANVPQEIVITSDVPHEVTLIVRDRGTNLLRYLVRPELPRLDLDFNAYDTREVTGHGLITTAQIQRLLSATLPSSSRIQAMKPDTLTFYYNRGVKSRIPVRYTGTVNTSGQYCCSHINVYPDSVDVYAPLSVLDTMKYVYTEPVAFHDPVEHPSARMGLRVPRGVKCRPDRVTVEPVIDILTRQSTEVPVVGINFPAGIELRTFPTRIKVSYMATAADAQRINEQTFAVTVKWDELRNDTTGQFTPHVTSTLPQLTRDIVTEPQYVDYLIENLHDH